MGIAELDRARHEEMFEELRARLQRREIDPCVICGGAGRVTVGLDYVDEFVELPRTEMCVCKSSAALKLGLFDAGVPQEFWTADQIDPTWNKHAFEVVQKFASRIRQAKEHGLGLVMVGENGTGKSSSAAIVAIEALCAGFTVAYLSFPDLVEGWKIAKTDQEHGTHLQERVMRDIVVLDEVGKEYAGAGAAKAKEVTAKLDALLRMRRGAFLPTVLITNLGYADLVEQYGASIASLLNPDRFKVLEYEPGDFRKELPRWDKLLGNDE